MVRDIEKEETGYDPNNSIIIGSDGNGPSNSTNNSKSLKDALVRLMKYAQKLNTTTLHDLYQWLWLQHCLMWKIRLKQ